MDVSSVEHDPTKLFVPRKNVDIIVAPNEQAVATVSEVSARVGRVWTTMSAIVMTLSFIAY